MMANRNREAAGHDIPTTYRSSGIAAGRGWPQPILLEAISQDFACIASTGCM